VQNFYLDIAVLVPLKNTFLYKPLIKTTKEQYKVGSRVLVPFRSRNNMVGIVVKIIDDEKIFKSYNVNDAKIKSITGNIDDNAIFDDKILNLAKWISKYYFAPIGEVFSLFLPKLLRAGKPLESIDSTATLSLNVDLSILKKNSITTAQKNLLDQLARAQKGLKEALLLDLGYKKSSIDVLLQKGFIHKKTVELLDIDTKTAIKDDKSHIELTNEQHNAVVDITNYLNKFKVFLLFGITGSGKTEIYIDVSRNIFKDKNITNPQILVLLPEIGLTPQIIKRFEKAFNIPVIAMHSKCTDTERARRWSFIKSGATCIVLGTRSAIFAPFTHLKLIIVDEEHDLSFRQHDGLVRYCARDLAIIRAKENNIPIILGSATPSFESYQNAISGKYSLIKMTKRAGTGAIPDINIVDIRSQKLDSGLSIQAIKAIKDEITKGGKVMIFLNRRGFAPILLCHDCSWIAKCKNCDSSLTVHYYTKSLICHHCNYTMKLVESCGKCGSLDINSVGFGTEQVEEYCKSHLCSQLNFTKENIIRIDRDTTSKKGSLENALQLINASDSSQIILGTQMLAKGHNFYKLNLVVILEPDFAFFSSDFRATEKSMQLLLQVCGRSGRHQAGGKVLLQTHFPEHELWQYLKKSDYKNFIESSLPQRLESQFPPFGFISLLRVEAFRFKDVMDFLHNAKNQGIILIKEYNYINIVNLLGPIPAPMARKNKVYRGQILVIGTNRKILHNYLKKWEESFLSKQNKIKWLLEIDPKDIY